MSVFPIWFEASNTSNTPRANDKVGLIVVWLWVSSQQNPNWIRRSGIFEAGPEAGYPAIYEQPFISNSENVGEGWEAPLASLFAWQTIK